MRILWTDIGEGAPVGGLTLRSLRTCAALIALGVDVELALLDRGLDDTTLQAHGIEPRRVHRFACLQRRFNLCAPEPRRLQALVARAQVVVLTSFLWGVAPWAWRAARRAGTPWVVSPAGIVPYFGRSLALKRACHGLFGASLLRGAAALIAVTGREAQALQACNARVEIIPNGVELARHDAIAARRGDGTPGRIELLFVGRLDAVKGVDLLLDAWATLPAAQRDAFALTLAGDGPQRAAWQAQAERLGLAPRVRFEGFVGEARKDALLARCDWLVVPSRRDAMTLVALEAAASGVPSLLTRECGFPALAQAGGGIDVDAGVAGLREGLQRVAATRAQWPAMGERARMLARERHGWDAIARQHLALFDDVIASRAQGHAPIAPLAQGDESVAARPPDDALIASRAQDEVIASVTPGHVPNATRASVDTLGAP